MNQALGFVFLAGLVAWAFGGMAFAIVAVLAPFHRDRQGADWDKIVTDRINSGIRDEGRNHVCTNVNCTAFGLTYFTHEVHPVCPVCTSPMHETATYLAAIFDAVHDVRIELRERGREK